jgi:tRNA A-37 threonylcarbamoyl transferase component Bud32
VTPAQYTRVKEVFAASTERPGPERAEFVRQQCADSPELIQDVLSLLGHHLENTILDDPQATISELAPVPSGKQDVVVARQASTPDKIDLEPRDPADTLVVNRQVWEENRQVLRRRLSVIAIVLSLLIAMSMVRLLTYHSAEIGFGSRVAAVVINLGCVWLMYRRRQLTLTQLRLTEVMVMGSAGLLVAITYVRLMLDFAISGDSATMVSVNNWNYFVWTLIIFIYGVFMPNTWQRAAAVLLPVALAPSLVAWFAGWLDPHVTELLKDDDFGRPIPTPFVAACIAIYAAHLIHGARLSALRARQLAQYKVNRLIGEGGMGQVYEAEHLLLKRKCALKVIHPEFSADDNALQRFENEVRATAQLTHPHTIEVYDFGQTKEGIFYFAMELLPGTDLGTLVASSGPLPASRAVHFVTQVCAALQEAHRRGMIHRDIKPANVFASQRGGIFDYTKLLDFGLVRRIDVDPGTRITPGIVAGTPGFMSPEQITKPGDVDVRTDIYAVAAVAYYLLTGRPPYAADSPLETMLDQVNHAPLAPSAIRPEVPADVESIILRCLAIDPDERIASAKQMRDELLRCECGGGWTEEDAEQWWADHKMDDASPQELRDTIEKGLPETCSGNP